VLHEYKLEAFVLGPLEHPKFWAWTLFVVWMDVHDFVCCVLSFVCTIPLADHQAKASCQI